MTPTISFEFFPPKSASAEAQMHAAAAQLAQLSPHYMTVTYGAGGSTRDGTLATLRRMKDNLGVDVASHLTFINTPREKLMAHTDALWNEGIRHIVALRGDMPKDLAWPLDPDAGYFQFTSDFVEALRAQHDFEISVAAYPEKHPDAPSLEADIIALKKKCDAGATRAITQFFFENDKFFAFAEKCEQAGITTPIYPGLLPIHDFAAMQKFAARCQASVPGWLHKKFDGRSADDARAIARDLLLQQAQDLAANGVSHLHFYTLNKAEITGDVCEDLR